MPIRDSEAVKSTALAWISVGEISLRHLIQHLRAANAERTGTEQRSVRSSPYIMRFPGSL